MRIRSHIKQLQSILDSAGHRPEAGFSGAEINREANTIGAKCQDVELARIVLI